MVLGRKLSPHTRLILMEEDIDSPVELILDAPMVAAAQHPAFASRLDADGDQNRAIDDLAFHAHLLVARCARRDGRR